jgi:uncharacterized Fe-S cluster protein YjdI
MRKTYADTEVDVSFDPEVCIHAAKCGRGLSAVFDTQRRPWIVPNAAEADEVVAQVGRCSSGALQAKRDVEPERLAPGPENLTTITAAVGAPGGSYPHRSARLRFCGSNRTVSLRIRVEQAVEDGPPTRRAGASALPRIRSRRRRQSRRWRTERDDPYLTQ